MATYPYSNKNPNKYIEMLFYLFLHGAFSKEEISQFLDETKSRSEKRLYFLEEVLGKDHICKYPYAKHIKYYAGYRYFHDQQNYLINLYLTKTTTSIKIHGFFYVMDVLFCPDDPKKSMQISEILDRLSYKGFDASHTSMKHLLDDMAFHGILIKSPFKNKMNYSLTDDILEGMPNDTLECLLDGLSFYSDISYPYVLGELTRRNLQAYLEVYRKFNPLPKTPIICTNIGFHHALYEELVFQLIPAIMLHQSVKIITDDRVISLIPSYFHIDTPNQDMDLVGIYNDEPISISVYDIKDISVPKSKSYVHWQELFEVFNEFESIYHYLLYYGIFYTDQHTINAHGLISKMNALIRKDGFLPLNEFYNKILPTKDQPSVGLFEYEKNTITSHIDHCFYINFSYLEQMYLLDFLDSKYAPLFVQEEAIRPLKSRLASSLDNVFASTKGASKLKPYDINRYFHKKSRNALIFPEHMKTTLHEIREHIICGSNFNALGFQSEIQPLRVQYDNFDDRFDLIFSHPDTDEIFIRPIEHVIPLGNNTCENEPDDSYDKQDDLHILIDKTIYHQHIPSKDKFLDEWLLAISVFERTIHHEETNTHITLYLYAFQLEDFLQLTNRYKYEAYTKRGTDL